MMFVVKNLRASRVNLTQNDFAAGLPSPLSFIGLGDAVVRDMALTPWSARVIPVLHRVDVSPGRTKPEMEKKPGGEFGPVQSVEDMVGSVEVSILIDLPGCDSASALSNAMTGKRIAGGIIQNDDIEVEAVTPDGSAFYAMRRGHAMVRPDHDHPDRLRISTGDEAGLKAITNTLFPEEEREPGFGWIVPVAAGYRLIEDPEQVQQRSGTRDPDIPHVFAEPALGIAELISVRNERLTTLTEDDLSVLLWSWEARGNLILGHPDYHPETTEKESSAHV